MGLVRSRQTVAKHAKEDFKNLERKIELVDAGLEVEKEYTFSSTFVDNEAYRTNPW